ncbi:MAG: sugar transferase [Desulfobacterales bacterium]|nr:sugar transferase [Desulfobacterales bacterium]
MFQQQVYIINTILMIVDAVCIIVAGYGAYFARYYMSAGMWRMDDEVFAASVLLIMFLNNYMMGRFQLYSDRRPESFGALAWSVFKTMICNFAVLGAGIFVFQEKTYSRLFLGFFAGFSFLLILIQRAIAGLYMDRLTKKGFNIRKILIVGSRKRAEVVSDVLSRQLSWGHEVVGVLATRPGEEKQENCLGNINDLPTVLREQSLDEVVFALGGDRSIDLAIYLNVCMEMGVPARILPALWNPKSNILSVENCQGIPFIAIQTYSLGATGLLYKRMLDLLGGIVGAVIFVLIYPFMAAAIKLDSKGPVMFCQKRVGRNGRVFSLYKFRSMSDDAEDQKQALMDQNEMEGAMFKLENDPRVTRVGKWLRKTSMDEFPQLLNVLKGEMSLVGTRPPTVAEVKTYKPQHLKRISSKPGITGLWQVSGRNKVSDFEQVVALDCQYLDNWQFSDDVKILLKTVGVVLMGKGAT